MEKLLFLKNIFLERFGIDLSPSSYVLDHRMTKPGSLFFALPGTKTHGKHFIDQAKQFGAIAAVVDNDCEIESASIPLLKVANVEEFLKYLARSLIEHFSPKIVAVTGSVGKTTTKDFISTLLGTVYKVCSTPGNANSQLGLPASILNNFQGTEDFLVLEMGMSTKGQIGQLVEIAPPHVALLTAIEAVHSCNFCSLEDIARAKAEIFSSPATQMKFVQKAAFAKLPMDVIANGGFKIYSGAKELKELVHFPAEHFYENLSGAIAVAKYFDVPEVNIKEAIGQLKVPKSRMERFDLNGIIFYDDAYNASEASVKSALEGIRINYQDKRRIAVLGPMLELGAFSYDCHRRVGEKAFETCEKLFCFGKEWKDLAESWMEKGFACEWKMSRKDLGRVLSEYLKKDDVVLLKGSRSTNTFEIINELARKV